LREHAPDRGRRIGIGRCGIVAAEGVDLGADHGLRGGDIVAGPGRCGEAGHECDQQDKGAHEDAPLAYRWLRASSPNGFSGAGGRPTPQKGPTAGAYWIFGNRPDSGTKIALSGTKIALEIRPAKRRSAK
jgi:hypothetical protein